MGQINLLIANSGGYFTDDEVTLINSARDRAVEFVSSIFDFDYGVDFVIAGPSYLMGTIPEDGISGRTYNSRFVIVVIDKEQAPFSEVAIYETICHEMSHSLRWEKQSEYMETMFDGMILEGLALMLEYESTKDVPASGRQFFLNEVLSTSDEDCQNALELLRPQMDSDEYDYEKVFFTGDDEIPRWAGYKLGYYLVKKYLEATDRTLAQATFDRYQDFRDQALY